MMLPSFHIFVASVLLTMQETAVFFS